MHVRRNILTLKCNVIKININSDKCRFWTIVSREDWNDEFKFLINHKNFFTSFGDTFHE